MKKNTAATTTAAAAETTTAAAAETTTAAAATTAATTKAAETTAAATQAETSAEQGGGATRAGGSVVARGGDLISFSYMRPVWNPPTYEKNNEFEKILFEAGNVKIEANIVPVVDYDGLIPARLAAGIDIDVIWSGGPTNSALKEAFDSGIFLPLDDYLERYPAVKNVVLDGVWETHRQADGHIYFFPSPLAPWVPFPIYYRQDILEKHGLPLPKTIDEFTDLLREIKQVEPEMIPLSSWELFSHWYFQNTARVFGYNFGWVEDPGDPSRIIPVDETQYAVDFYTWMNLLCRENLMDPDFKIAQGKNGLETFKTGTVFAIAAHWGGYYDLLYTLRQQDPNVKIGAITDLTGPNGRMGGQTMTGFDRGFAINAKSANKAEEIFTYLNWLYTDGYDLCRYGVEGETYNIVDGRYVSIPNDDRNPEFGESNREAVNFPLKAEHTLPNWMDEWIRFQNLGLTMEDLEVVRHAFEDSVANAYLNYFKPGMYSPTNADIGSMLDEARKQVLERTMIDPSMNMQDFIDAQQRWLEDGGNTIIQEINEAQGSFRPSKMEYINTNDDYR